MKRRRHILCLLIIVASLFLYSCGVPTICTLNNLSISKVSKSDNTVEFTIKGTDSDLDLVSTSCPGLLLCYVESNSFVLTNVSEVTNAFSNTVTNKVYIDNNNVILTTDNYTLYAFQKDTEGTRVSTPSFSLNLHPDITDTTMDADIIVEYVADQEFFITDSINNQNLYVINEDRAQTENYFIHIFAAFSAEQGDFTNTYWSNLLYVGCIDMSL